MPHEETTIEQSRFSGFNPSRGRGRGRFGAGRRAGTESSQASREQPQARVFAMTREEAKATPTVITGNISIFSINAHVLFDPGATHSFISQLFASYFGKPESLG